MTKKSVQSTPNRKKNKVFFLHLNVDKIRGGGPMAREPSHRAGWRPMAN